MSSVSFRYATSLAEICKEDNSFYDVYEQFSSLMNFLDENNEVKKVITGSTFGATDKKVVVDSIFEDGDSVMLKNFLCLLIDKNRIDEIDLIYLDFQQLYLDHFDIIDVKVVTATELDYDVKSSLEDKLKAKLGKDIVLTEEVDSTIIGGMVLYIKGRVIDLSVQQELLNLKKQLKESKIV